jgi:hypothetical protein
MAVTITRAKTVARLTAIKINVAYLLRIAAGLSNDSMDIIDKILDDKAANTFRVYGFNSNMLCRAQLDLSIDWNEHGIQINNGKTYVAIDENIDGSCSDEVIEMARVFNKFTKQYSLTKEYRVAFCPGVDYSKYGFETGGDIQWDGEKQTLTNLDVQQLPELCLGLYASF